MRHLFPEISPFRTQMIAVDSIHTLYLEQCGNPAGIPVLFLHGGPGAGTTPTHRRFFDPKRYHIILFDQRGCGKSTPHAELRDNTTGHLVNDIETLRRHLGIKQWLVFGGSWGSTLALAYAEHHPDRVSGLILRGIFLCRDEDIAWFYQHGTSRLFPDYWQDFLAPVAERERGDMVNAYYRLLTGNNPDRQMAAAVAWSVWEGRTATLLPDPATEQYFSRASVALSMARIECHYFVNHSFIEPDQLLTNAHQLSGIPGTIVHGRYDVICPLDQALALKQAWPGADLRIITDAGHAVTEPGITDALITATEHFADEATAT